MTQTDPEEITEIIDRRRPPTSWVKYAAWAAVGVAFIVCSYLFLVKFTPREVAGTGMDTLERGAVLTRRFLDHLGLTASKSSTHAVVQVGEVVAVDKSGPMVVAQQDFVLKFDHVDERLYGTSTTDVRVAAKAYYYVPLLGPGAEWKIETVEKDGVRVCVVHAPALRALTPISVDTRSIEIKTSTGLLRANEKEMSAAALADITPRLNREALEQAPRARNAARKTIASFVKNWLLSSSGWGDRKMNAIQVLFPGETTVDTDFVIPGFYESP